MCTGRIDMSFVLRAFANGADGVYVGGCWPGQCHYITDGNYSALSMVHMCKKLLAHIGMDPDRLRLEWTSAGEGIRFAEVVNDFTRKLTDLGPNGIDEDTPEKKRMKAKLQAAQSIVPYVRLVERERMRVKFKDLEDYPKYFNSPEINKLFDELVVDRLEISQIMNLLREKPLTTEEIAEMLDMTPAEVTKCLITSSKEGLVRFDEERKQFSPV
jgi:F420-non-reducing hydrogenase iron-sulfur subunit